MRGLRGVVPGQGVRPEPAGYAGSVALCLQAGRRARPGQYPRGSPARGRPARLAPGEPSPRPPTLSSQRITASSTGSVLGPDAATAGRRAPARPLDAEARGGHERAALATAAGTVALVLMMLGSLGYVAVVASRASILSPGSFKAFPGWMAGPLAPLATAYHPGDAARKMLLTALVGGMYVCYLVVLACSSRLRARWAIAAVVVLELIFFLSPPLSLTDVFNYINYGRMQVLYGLNPYATIPALGPHLDLSYQLSNWHSLLSPYGPVFTLFSFALVPLGIGASFWVLKGTLLLASLGSLWLVWRCAELLGRDPLRAVLFVGLNPLVLVWGLGGDHNDFILVFLVMLAVYLLLDARTRRPAAAATEPGPGREVGAGFLLMAAVAVKASAGMLLPIFLLGAPRRLRLLAGMALGGVVLGGVAVYAFGARVPNLAQQSTLITLVGLPNVIGYLLGYGGVTDTMKAILDAILVGAVVAAAVWAARTRDWIVPAGYATVALLLTLTWELPWYVLWLLPFAALARGRALRVAALVISLYLMLAWMPLMTDLIHSVGFKPSLTLLGKMRQVKTLTLLH